MTCIIFCETHSFCELPIPSDLRAQNQTHFTGIGNTKVRKIHSRIYKSRALFDQNPNTNNLLMRIQAQKIAMHT